MESNEAGVLQNFLQNFSQMRIVVTVQPEEMDIRPKEMISLIYWDGTYRDGLELISKTVRTFGKLLAMPLNSIFSRF